MSPPGTMGFEAMAVAQNEDMVECVKKKMLSMTTEVIVDIIKEVALSREAVKDRLINEWLVCDYESQVQAFLAGDGEAEEEAEEEVDDDSYVEESTSVCSSGSSDDTGSPIQVAAPWKSPRTKQLDPDSPAFLPGALSLAEMLPTDPAYVQQSWFLSEDSAIPCGDTSQAQRPCRQQLELSSLIQTQVTGESKQQRLQRTLLIAYFPRRASEEDLLAVLSWVAKVTSVRIVRANTGESRCYCFAEFETLHGAEEAYARCLEHRLVMNDESGRSWYLTATWARNSDIHARSMGGLKDARSQGVEHTSTTKDGRNCMSGKLRPLSPGKLKTRDAGGNSRKQARQVSLAALLT